MKLSSVAIKNFQSHCNTTLEFVPGVNVVVGLSDTGKSAIFRALIWALFNRPRGDGFRSHWSGKEATDVTIAFDDGNVLGRTKGNAINQYLINETVLKAFGHDPPDEVLQLHKINRTLNIQSQIDPFFLLQSSPGEVSGYLNQIAQLEDIDRVAKKLQTHVRSTQRNLDAQVALEASTTTQLTQFKDLEQVDKELIKAEMLEAELAATRERYDEVKQTVQKIKQAQRRHDSGMQQLKEVEPQLQTALLLQTKVAQAKDRISGLRKTITAIQQAERRIMQARDQLTAFERQWHQAMPKGAACPLCGHAI